MGDLRKIVDSVVAGLIVHLIWSAIEKKDSIARAAKAPAIESRRRGAIPAHLL